MYNIINKLIVFGAGDCNPSAGAKGFLGFPPWYKYLDGKTDALGKCIPIVDFENDPGNLWTIALVIVDILIRIGALVAVGFIIYAGFQYMTSNGDPQKTASAKDTIINALVGLVIAIIAASVVSFIGNSIK